MTTQVIWHGRVVYRKGPAPFRPAVHSPRSCHPLPSSELPPAVGEAYRDEDGLNYRVVGVGVLRPEDGWARAEFWLKRWKLVWKQFADLVERGLLDPAMETGSMVKKYRCRDEGACLARIEVLKTRRRRL